jgi:parallel beta-helix repeat protein
MKRAYIFAFTLVGLTYLPVSATIINIPDDYPTIQQGIDASTDGDTVLVQPGTYVENIDFDGNNIVLSSIFLLTGDTLHISSTIIDGDSSGTVIEFWDGVTASVTGFTIQNGYQLFAPGGIYCGIDSRPFIMNNRIMNNTGSSSAGGIFIREGSFPTIKNNFISENFSSGSGGGIFCGGEAIIINNIIIENSSVLWGGGIDCFRAYPLIANNIISHNLSREGGGIFFHSSDPFIMNNIISGNVADSTGVE